MKTFRWHTRQKILCAETSDGEVFIPTAMEIYSFVFGENDHVRGYGPKGSGKSADKDPEFSRYPIELTVLIASKKMDQKRVLECRVAGNYKGEPIELGENFNGSVDHVLNDGIWHPIIDGGLDDIQDILESANISEPGPISLRQYLDLLTDDENQGLIEDLSEKAASADNVQVEGVEPSIPQFVADLYDYQKNGFRWLTGIADEGLGCILADQMGLGKTIQIIALICLRTSNSIRPSLIICPTTLLENWRREFLRFTEGMSVFIHHGPDRTGYPNDLANLDAVITTYEIAVRDNSMFMMVDWDLVVLDEAQAIKNPFAKRTLAVKKLTRNSGIAVTGTPVENRLTDLWSIADFAVPDLLGTLDTFENRFSETSSAASRLEPTISPILLRRLVKDVAKDLPDLIYVPQAITMDEISAAEYDQLREKIISEKGPSGNLEALLRLRMYCTHPDIVSNEEGEPTRNSLKYIRLLEILDEIFENNEKVIIFTSFKGMIDVLSSDIANRYGVYTDCIDGRTGAGDRVPKVDRFSEIRGSAMLALNPRAAGTGLNITSANHVIHYNLEWNPAVEDQATARAHRLGQTMPVTVHRLFYANTVEDVINERLERKRTLAKSAVVGVSGEEQDRQDLKKALQTSPFISTS